MKRDRLKPVKLGLLLVFFFSLPAFAQDVWHVPAHHRVQKDQVSLDVPLTSSWQVSPVAEGELDASNAGLKAKLTVRIIPMTASLDTAVGNQLPPSFCTDLTRHIFTKENLQMEEAFCFPSPSRVELGRFFFVNGDFVAVEAQVDQEAYADRADEIWGVIRAVQVESKAAPPPVSEGETLYKSPDGIYSLVYPEKWQTETTGKNLLLYLPNGPSIQVIPAADSFSGNDPKDILADFQYSLAYTLKGFKLENTGELTVSGNQEPMMSYDYLLPNGTPEKAWAVALSFSNHPFLFVCSAPSSDFDGDIPSFRSALNSFQVKR